MKRKSYPSDVSDEEWASVVPYLSLIREDAPNEVMTCEKCLTL